MAHNTNPDLASKFVRYTAADLADMLQFLHEGENSLKYALPHVASISAILGSYKDRLDYFLEGGFTISHQWALKDHGLLDQFDAFVDELFEYECTVTSGMEALMVKHQALIVALSLVQADRQFKERFGEMGEITEFENEISEADELEDEMNDTDEVEEDIVGLCLPGISE